MYACRYVCIDVLQQSQGFYSGGGLERLHWLQLYHQEKGSSKGRGQRPPCRFWRIWLLVGATLVGWHDYYFNMTVIVGEIANFVAYIYAPAVLVTPLGALSIIVSAILAHFILKEKLQKMGMLGCLLCIVGSTVIVLHAPEERSINSVEEIWELATQPAFLLYTASAVAIALVLILYCAPRYGQTNIMVYIGICSVIGSLTVMSIKAIGIAIKLTLEGTNQAKYFQTWIFAMVAITCIITQLNYLNMALDTFNTAIVSPIYYALFTSFTILASAIMFKDYSGQSASSIASELCGFVTVLSGTAVLHSTRDPDTPLITDLYTPLSPKVSWYIQGNGELWKQKDEDGSSPSFITILRQDYFKSKRW
ncbi:Non-imprinted in Prader-Willi/Angelman syndrome region protein isoform 2 [Theobroma cacao]|uniref:Probable magnesium transporter n=2 Tax=Theobroma cacao TaxID=3641 RepID=A0A061DVM6_THECC|nr:Non-imprinted in Prader-Willi/Angelman syndrome region protein isoform 2 [Theobroma cacao]